MKQEDKYLLLHDLCARLPYGVKIDVTYSKDSGSSLRARLCSEGINILDINILGLFQQSEIYIKPYLFPLSSMTEEQLYELRELFGFEIEFLNGFIDLSSRSTLEYLEMVAIIEWFSKNHFDYVGLIPMGLAIDCTNLNIY